MAAGPDGIVAAETILNHTDQATAMVWVRGHDLPTLVEHHDPEGTVALPWEDFAGAGLTRNGLTRRLGRAREAAYAALSGWLPQTAGTPCSRGCASPWPLNQMRLPLPEL